jgi:NAD(P)-dependent dehydrogenase (short-subunit alcohol dehydrogenase family)
VTAEPGPAAGPSGAAPVDPFAGFRLDGRVALVTGASSGLGARFTLVLRAAGATVVAAARRLDRLEALAADDPGIIPVAVDLLEPDAPRRLVEDTVARCGALDVVVNNAGVSRVVAAVDDDVDAFRRELELDLVVPYELARHSAAWMIGAGRPGSVVNLGSILGQVAGGRLRVPGYAAAKGGLHQLTRELASQWARKGVRVNALAPAWFETEMNADAMFGTEAGRRYIEDNTPMGRGGEPHELDGALLFLAGDASSFVTGHVLVVDGGWTAL